MPLQLLTESKGLTTSRTSVANVALLGDPFSLPVMYAREPTLVIEELADTIARKVKVWVRE